MKSFDSAPFSSDNSLDTLDISLSQSNIVPFVSPKTTASRQTTSEKVQPSLWQELWDLLYRLLMPSSTLKIRQKRGTNGQEYYHVYDPVTGTDKTFGSELETRIWLDRRFYD
ncbi:MAG: hypothetical protein MUF72_01405 [Elainella sp. Prado103]|jgi:hypothetical protein|nr:hypothetical protein [Elainella sp. Prado103]